MIKPSIEELSKNKYNRYQLVIATSKCAHKVTDEYVRQRTEAEKRINDRDSADKPLSSMITKELRDEKAVKNAINMLYTGEYKIVEPEENN